MHLVQLRRGFARPRLEQCNNFLALDAPLQAMGPGGRVPAVNRGEIRRSGRDQSRGGALRIEGGIHLSRRPVHRPLHVAVDQKDIAREPGGLGNRSWTQCCIQPFRGDLLRARRHGNLSRRMRLLDGSILP